MCAAEGIRHFLPEPIQIQLRGDPTRWCRQVLAVLYGLLFKVM